MWSDVQVRWHSPHRHAAASTAVDGHPERTVTTYPPAVLSHGWHDPQVSTTQCVLCKKCCDSMWQPTQVRLRWQGGNSVDLATLTRDVCDLSCRKHARVQLWRVNKRHVRREGEGHSRYTIVPRAGIADRGGEGSVMVFHKPPSWGAITQESLHTSFHCSMLHLNFSSQAFSSSPQNCRILPCTECHLHYWLKPYSYMTDIHRSCKSQQKLYLKRLSKARTPSKAKVARGCLLSTHW